jgi:putative lipoic acid-binding regulatory protein
MTEEDLIALRNTIIQTQTFPSVYMYKFIVESENRKIALIENLFDDEVDIHIKESVNGKYTSITAKAVVIHVDEIITVYKKVSEIKGVIFL